MPELSENSPNRSYEDEEMEPEEQEPMHHFEPEDPPLPERMPWIYPHQQTNYMRPTVAYEVQRGAQKGKSAKTIQMEERVRKTFDEIHTFKPSTKGAALQESALSKEDRWRRLLEPKTSKEQKWQKQREKKAVWELDECTFKPNISSTQIYTHGKVEDRLLT